MKTSCNRQELYGKKSKFILQISDVLSSLTLPETIYGFTHAKLERPCSTAVFVAQLVDPSCFLVVEAIAARPKSSG